MDDSKYYSLVNEEIKNNKWDEALKLRCFSEAPDNENQQKALYIKYRVEQLKSIESNNVTYPKQINTSQQPTESNTTKQKGITWLHHVGIVIGSFITFVPFGYTILNVLNMDTYRPLINIIYISLLFYYFVTPKNKTIDEIVTIKRERFKQFIYLIIFSIVGFISIGTFYINKNNSKETTKEVTNNSGSSEVQGESKDLMKDYIYDRANKYAEIINNVDSLKDISLGKAMLYTDDKKQDIIFWRTNHPINADINNIFLHPAKYPYTDTNGYTYEEFISLYEAQCDLFYDIYNQKLKLNSDYDLIIAIANTDIKTVIEDNKKPYKERKYGFTGFIGFKSTIINDDGTMWNRCAAFNNRK